MSPIKELKKLASELSKFALHTFTITRTIYIYNKEIDDYVEKEANITIYATPYVPAKLTGHPDSWYPEEGGDFDIEEIEDAETGENLMPLLSYKEVKELESKLKKDLEQEAREP